MTAPIVDLTAEQRAVVEHPVGRHAMVLAVAGSGKTRTLVERVRYLVTQKRVSPNQICILMFNKLARKQFQERLVEARVPEEQRPAVHTFHSFSSGIIRKAVQRGVLAHRPQEWIEDKSELILEHVKRAIRNLQGRGDIPRDVVVPPEEANEAIGLWKNELIPPEHAGYHGELAEWMPLVYKEYEKLRTEQRAITFDDFVPLAVSVLTLDAELREQSCAFRHVIVDEYQDVNWGQEVLIRILAGEQADIMVVGDDDQTIYEWRAARLDYLRDFPQRFPNKPTECYKLSHSFRFGPVIAQCAENVIGRNHYREQKDLLAHDASKRGTVQTYLTDSEESTDPHLQIAKLVRKMVFETKRPEVAVLGRTFAQLAHMEAAFMKEGIPYKVRGRQALFQRHEVRGLLGYLVLGDAHYQNRSLDGELIDTTSRILNWPNRAIAKGAVVGTLKAGMGMQPRWTLRQGLDAARQALKAGGKDRFDDFEETLAWVGQMLHGAKRPIWEVLVDLAEKQLDLQRHFESYYGKGLPSFERMRSVQALCIYVKQINPSSVRALMQHVASLDTTRLGGNEDEKRVVLMTTVFRVKGLEYDHVVIPACVEGYMPVRYPNEILTYDKRWPDRRPPASPTTEAERRLFYVALTRARNSVRIAVSADPPYASEDSRPPLPSRFVLEMMEEPTRELMTALQKFAAAGKSLYPHSGPPVRSQGVRDAYKSIE